MIKWLLRILRGRKKYGWNPLTVTVRVIAGENLKLGQFVYMVPGSNEVVGKPNYTLLERSVRYVGRMLKRSRMSRWHEWHYAGVVMGSPRKGEASDIAVYGLLKIK